jgi:sterol desaturase/sphingolipid hydroxylase (fatty acid hydroxylase superfamily)
MRSLKNSQNPQGVCKSGILESNTRRWIRVFQLLMGELRFLYHEVISFLGIDSLLDLLRKGDYACLLTLDGIKSILIPLMPLLLVIELFRGLIYRRFKVIDYKVPFFIYVFNRFISSFISFAVVLFCVGHFQKFGIIRTHFTWYWLLYGYIAWELSHFVYHYLAHKVRLLWCLHSTHHAPVSMNLSVSYAHFFLEAPYADMIRTTGCMLLGVDPALLYLIMFIDGFWGAFIHVGDNILKDGRLGFLNRFILTPSHHRVHHARNPLYMDTNFCNLLNIWDRIFKTWQPEKKEVRIEYGITRPIDAGNFLDVYFGEIRLLWLDVRKAPGIRNKLLYLFMPPGWNHEGNEKTAHSIRQAFLHQHLPEKEK